jgi:hypothetical protein
MYASPYVACEDNKSAARSVKAVTRAPSMPGALDPAATSTRGMSPPRQMTGMERCRSRSDLTVTNRISSDEINRQVTAVSCKCPWVCNTV